MEYTIAIILLRSSAFSKSSQNSLSDQKIIKMLKFLNYTSIIDSKLTKCYNVS